MSIKGIVWGFIGLGLLMMVLYLWPPLADIYDTLGMTDNQTWSQSATENVTATSPLSQDIAVAWKYIMLFVVVGGILFLIRTAMKGGGRSDE